MHKCLWVLLLGVLIPIFTATAEDNFCQEYEAAFSKSKFSTKTGYFAAVKDESLAKQLDEEGKNG